MLVLASPIAARASSDRLAREATAAIEAWSAHPVDPQTETVRA
jgi:hypothetical protein